MATVTLQPGSKPAAPLAPGHPIIGSALGLLADPMAFFVKSYLTVGPVFRVKAPTRDYLVLAGPQVNRWLMQGGEHYLDQKPLYQHIATQLDDSCVLARRYSFAHLFPVYSLQTLGLSFSNRGSKQVGRVMSLPPENCQILVTHPKGIHLPWQLTREVNEQSIQRAYLR